MNPRRCATATAALTVIFAAWVVAWLAGFDSAVIGSSGAAPLDRAASLAADADHADRPQATAMGDTTRDGAGEARSGADLTGSLQTLPPETPPLQATTATSAPDMKPDDRRDDTGSIEIVDECLVMDTCIDRYLWKLYQCAPKEDAIKVEEQRKVAVKKRGKTRIVTRTFTRSVDEDFGWKDPKAAEKAGMPMTDYVIGGMDRAFKLRLFQALHAAEENGLSPGITSAFRDDYRQSLASGLHAANDRSYHGGSLRGGYGHGLAADIVSVNGGTRDQRWASSELLWKWIDEHGKDFGIGRPYLDRDPAHVAPIDGKEYADHHSGATTRHAESRGKSHKRLAVRDDHNVTKRQKTARSS
jgi:hypothetical protein